MLRPDHPANRATRFGLPRSEAWFALFVTLFCVVLVVTNIIGIKLFLLTLPGFLHGAFGTDALTLTSGNLSYPITFVCTDIVSEIWGRRRANLMVVLGFAMSAVMLVLVTLAKHLPPSPAWINPDPERYGPIDMQAAFEVSFSAPGILLFASMTAYLAAQLFDVRLYHFWWRLTNGRHMWIRNNGSTMISQLVDTIIVNAIFLSLHYGMAWSAIWVITLHVYLAKMVTAWVDTPLIYGLRALLRSDLGLDADDSPAHAPLAESL